MDSNFRPHVDILPSSQRRLWAELSEIPDYFVLYGGTAIALWLGHRESLDFDFFADRELTTGWHLNEPLLKDATTLQAAPNTLTLQIDRGGPVRLSFFGVP